MNTCEMFTLGVDLLAPPLPRIPSQVEFFGYLVLAVSSTMGSEFLNHEVRDSKSSIARKCSAQFLDSNKKDIENIAVLV